MTEKEKLISELEEMILLLKSDKIEIGMIMNHKIPTMPRLVRESKWKEIKIQYKLNKESSTN